MRKVLAAVALAAAALAVGVGGAAAVVIDFGTVTGRTVFDIPTRELGVLEPFDDTYTFTLAPTLFEPGRGIVFLTLTLDQVTSNGQRIDPADATIITGPGGALLLTGPAGPGFVQPIFGDPAQRIYTGFPTIAGPYTVPLASFGGSNGGAYSGTLNVLPLPAGAALLTSALAGIAIGARTRHASKSSA